MKKTGSSFFSEQSRCAYFRDGRTATMEYVFADEKNAANFHLFLAKGYRRWANIFYRNDCGDCSACLPLRIQTDKFRPSDSQKRALKKNGDVQIEISASVVTDEKLAIYRKYLLRRHGRRETGEMRSYEALMALHHGYPFIREMDYYLDSKLIGVGIVDESYDSLSSNYFYYDTDYSGRRPGVFSILTEISLASAMEKKYLYLGFQIEENPRMSYKKYFRPNQIYEGGKWREFMK